MIEKLIELMMRLENFEGCVGDGIAYETRLFEDLGLDSLDKVELGLHIEGEYEIDIPDEEVKRWETFGDVVQSVERRFG